MNTPNTLAVPTTYRFKDISVTDFSITIEAERIHTGQTWSHRATVAYRVNGKGFTDFIALQEDVLSDVRAVKDMANLFLEQLTTFLKLELKKEVMPDIENSFNEAGLLEPKTYGGAK